MRDKIVNNSVIQLKEDLVTVLGPNLELNNCVIESFADGKGIVLAGVVMQGGVFDQRVKLSDFHFRRATFDSVKFKGEYSGCDFGDWDDTVNPHISRCDFSAAVMDGCRFLNCDMAGIVTPKWPCFRWMHPATARDLVMSKSWPKGVGLILDISTDIDPECVAIVLDASVIAKDSNLPLEQLRPMLEAIPGVEIED